MCSIPAWLDIAITICWNVHLRSTMHKPVGAELLQFFRAENNVPPTGFKFGMINGQLTID